MPRRRSSQHAAQAHDHDFEETPLTKAPSPKRNCCVVCRDQLTFFKVKHRRAYAHPLCAWLDRKGMAELAKTSGRWF